MSVGILLKYFLRKLLQFGWSKTVSKLGIFRFISLTKLCSAASFARTPLYSILNFTYLEVNSFSITQWKTSWIYLDIAEFQSFCRNFPPLTTCLRRFLQSLSRPKSKTKLQVWVSPELQTTLGVSSRPTKFTCVDTQVAQALFMNHTNNTVWHRIIRVCMEFS